MHRQAFLLAAGGALASCSPTDKFPRHANAGAAAPQSTCVPSVQYDPKSGVLWAYGCTTTGYRQAAPRSSTPLRTAILNFDGAVRQLVRAVLPRPQ